MMNFSNPEIAQIMIVGTNQQCVDCLAPNPTFTSLNNAVFLCENCANAHRGLGPNISIVKSLNDQFSVEEINLLKIGGNLRFNTLMGEFGITSDQNKEFKYHLKLADYYRRLLIAELNKENNPNQYQELLNNKPNPEIGLQIMESVTAESINQAQQNQSEIAKDVSNLFGKITGIISSVGSTLTETAHNYGIDQKLQNMKEQINEGVKNFNESHPTINSAVNTALDGLKTAGNMAGEAATKIINSEPVQNMTKTVNEKYQEVMNSETVKNLSKKAEEEYISLKKAAIEKFGSSNNNNAQGNQPPAK